MHEEEVVDVLGWEREATFGNLVLGATKAVQVSNSAVP
jgi:hypothetical protein